MSADTLGTVRISLQSLSATVEAAAVPQPFKPGVVRIADVVLQIISTVEVSGLELTWIY